MCLWISYLSSRIVFREFDCVDSGCWGGGFRDGGCRRDGCCRDGGCRGGSRDDDGGCRFVGVCEQIFLKNEIKLNIVKLFIHK